MDEGGEREATREFEREREWRRGREREREREWDSYALVRGVGPVSAAFPLRARTSHVRNRFRPTPVLTDGPNRSRVGYTDGIITRGGDMGRIP